MGGGSAAKAGELKTFAYLDGAPPSERGLFLSASGLATAQDSAVVSGLGPAGALLTFMLRLDGHLVVNTANVPFPFNSAVSASYQFTGKLSNDTTGATDRQIHEACVNNPNSSISTCNIPGGSSGMAADTLKTVQFSIFANDGDTISIWLDLRSSALGYTPRGNSLFAESDYFHTAQWLGLVPSNASAGVSLISQSTGFNYAQSIPGVPEPSAWALLILGFGIVGAGMRTRRDRRLSAAFA